MSLLNPYSHSPKVTYRVLTIGALVLLAHAAMAVDVDPALAQAGAAVEVEAAAKVGEYAVSMPDVLGETAPIGPAAMVAPCPLGGCSEGCTGGPNCHAYAKCQGRTCMPTVQTKNCRGTWMR